MRPPVSATATAVRGRCGHRRAGTSCGCGMCREPRFRMNIRLPAALTAAALSAAVLSACIVVPVDPHTGQPYGPNHGSAYNPGPLVVVPPAPPPLTMTARLYPLNEAANRAGMLVATVVDRHGGRGSFSVGYLGDLLQGEATRAERGQRGVANGVGQRGVNAQCDYVITGPGLGTGTCVFSDGAQFQMHFGGQ